jgi:hypothetical protein
MSARGRLPPDRHGRVSIADSVDRSSGGDPDPELATQAMQIRALKTERTRRVGAVPCRRGESVGQQLPLERGDGGVKRQHGLVAARGVVRTAVRHDGGHELRATAGKDAMSSHQSASSAG